MAILEQLAMTGHAPPIARGACLVLEISFCLGAVIIGPTIDLKPISH